MYRSNILNFTRSGLAEWFEARGIAPYRADQVFKWVFLRQCDSFEEMTDISKELRSMLADNFEIGRLAIAGRKRSADGTVKYLFTLPDGEKIESVLIPEDDHYTLCISTQVGCAQGCAFCRTARLGFRRNLEPAEITAQVRDVKKDLGEAGKLTNIVVMGMGEPLANYDNVIRSLGTITDGDFGLQFSRRKVTLSTSGIVPMIKRLGHDTSVNLAVSLNATDNSTRDMLMPVNRKFPIEVLLDACASYPLSNRRKITFEYILIEGVNDTMQDAERLARLLRPIKAKINLIPFNEHDGCDFRRPSEDTVEIFRQILHGHGYTVITRLSRGCDIGAACGQLAAKESSYGDGDGTR